MTLLQREKEEGDGVPKCGKMGPEMGLCHWWQRQCGRSGQLLEHGKRAQGRGQLQLLFWLAEGPHEEGATAWAECRKLRTTPEKKGRENMENKTHLETSYIPPLQKCFPCQTLENNLLRHKLKRGVLEETPPRFSSLDLWILRRWANPDPFPVAF